MSWRAQLSPILDNDRITRGLEDAEARMLIEWLVERAESMASDADLDRLVLRARAIAKFVTLWCHKRLESAALQLAATERFAWPLPTQALDACDLMEEILAWESVGPEADCE
jgi:hypothetical protein